MEWTPASLPLLFLIMKLLSNPLIITLVKSPGSFFFLFFYFFFYLFFLKFILVLIIINRYLPPGSVRIGANLSFNSPNLYATAFMNPSSDVIIVIMNSNNWYIDLNITDYGRTMAPRVPAHGIITLLYQSWSNY